MKNSLKNLPCRILVAFPLMVLLFQICPPAISAGGSGGEFYLTGEQLLYGLRALHVIDKVKNDAITPYDFKAYYKYDSESKKLSKIEKREYLYDKGASPDRQWAVELIETKIDENHMDVKRLLYSADNPAYVMKVGDIYAWSPQGNRICYLVCKPNCPSFEDCPYQYTCDAWIYNMKANAKKRLNVNAYDVSWPSFDKNIYFNLAQEWDPPRIIRYHPDSGKIEGTPYQGINFSPSGKYYMKEQYDEEPFYLYQREPHRELIEIEKQFDKQWKDKGFNRSGGAIWLADGHSLLIGRFVYDLDKMAFTKDLRRDAFMGMNRSRTHGLIMTGVDQFKVIDLLAP